MTRVLLIAVCAGLASAICFLALRPGFMGLLVLAYFAPAPIVATGLALGFSAAAISVAVAVASVFTGIGAFASVLYLLANGIPALIVCRYALQNRTDEETGDIVWASPGSILGVVTLYGTLVIAAAVVYYAGSPGGLEGHLRTTLRPFIEALLAPAPDRIPFWVEFMPRYFAGAMVSGWMLITLIDSVLAQRLVHRGNVALRPSPAYRDLTLPRWVEFAFLVALILAFLPGSFGVFGRNAALLLSIPFLLLGLAVIHTLSQRFAGRLAALTAFYVLAILMSWPWLIAVALGLAEQWLSLRQRFGGGGAQEDE